jgi:hypothetical protein
VEVGEAPLTNSVSWSRTGVGSPSRFCTSVGLLTVRFLV